MSYLQALYGSQYYELSQNGKDGMKGRLNGNLFLSAFVIIALFLFATILFAVAPSLKDSMDNWFHHLAGSSSGKFVGKLVAAVLLFVVYMVVSRTIGSEESYKRIVDEFNQYPESEKKEANKKIFKPFLIALATLLALMLYSLHS